MMRHKIRVSLAIPPVAKDEDLQVGAVTHFIFCRGSDTLSQEWEACSRKETSLIT